MRLPRTGLRTAATSLAALCALAVGAFAQTVKVNIGYVTAADYLPAFVSKENGCFAANGIDAHLHPHPGHHQHAGRAHRRHDADRCADRHPVPAGG